jgi:hypothetical protein
LGFRPLRATSKEKNNEQKIRLNAFDMNCVVHQSAGSWRHPRDRSDQYARLDYWIELAKILDGEAQEKYEEYRHISATKEH